MVRCVWLVALSCGFALSNWHAAILADDEAQQTEAKRFVELQQRFRSGLDATRQKYDLPGVTAAYVLPDGTVSAFATGVADLESGAPMTPDTRMPAGSIGKTFAAATVVALARDGKLSLDDKIEKWLGNEPWFADLPNGREITIRHLLMHRSGLADHIYEEAFVKKAVQLVTTNPDYNFEHVELVQYILKRDPLFPVGTSYKYTDTGYILLGLIIERAAGTTYYKQVTDRFLVPLKLTLTEPADHRDMAHIASGYLAPDNPFGLPRKITEDGKLLFNPTSEWTGGGLVSNPQDLVRWAKALYEGKAIKQPYLDELVRTDPQDKDRHSKYGLGVYVTDTDFGTSYGHSGWFVGYLSHLAYFPAERTAIAFQVNSDARSDMLGDLMALAGDVLTTVGKSSEKQSP